MEPKDLDVEDADREWEKKQDIMADVFLDSDDSLPKITTGTRIA